MNEFTIADAIERFNGLSLDDKEYALTVFKKNISESKREKLIKRVKEARKNFNSGKVKKGTLEDLYQDLEND